MVYRLESTGAAKQVQPSIHISISPCAQALKANDFISRHKEAWLLKFNLYRSKMGRFVTWFVNKMVYHSRLCTERSYAIRVCDIIVKTDLLDIYKCFQEVKGAFKLLQTRSTYKRSATLNENPSYQPTMNASEKNLYLSHKPSDDLYFQIFLL